MLEFAPDIPFQPVIFSGYLVNGKPLFVDILKLVPAFLVNFSERVAVCGGIGADLEAFRRTTFPVKLDRCQAELLSSLDSNCSAGLKLKQILNPLSPRHNQPSNKKAS